MLTICTPIDMLSGLVKGEHEFALSFDMFGLTDKGSII